MKFSPILKSMIWGGDRIIPLKGVDIDMQNVGESWEISGVKGSESIVANGGLQGYSISQLLLEYGGELVGECNYKRFGDEFPLLVKFIDAKQDLSIQVHPNDELAEQRHKSKGKTEMWYVINGDGGAKLRCGFETSVTPEEYVRSVEDDTVTSLLKEYKVDKGDIFFIPAGRIHSIGAGCLIAEIQQTSDITYRIYDFKRKDAAGNTRKLHTEEAKDAIDYSVLAEYKTLYDQSVEDQIQEVVRCPYFTTSIFNLTTNFTINYSALDSFVIYICTEGSCLVNSVPLKAGETLLLPANIALVTIESEGCTILSSHIL